MLALRSRRATAGFSWLSLAATALLSCACSPDERSEACVLDDADGVIGGEYRFQLSVDDLEFSQKILKTQNSARVSLTLYNAGSTAHGFAVDCLPTPNDDGCPEQACFPSEARVAGLGPGETTRIEFEVPRAEGIYLFRSAVASDTQHGQFVVQ